MDSTRVNMENITQVGTIDCTPTWEGLLPSILASYKYFVVKMSKRIKRTDVIERLNSNINFTEHEFKIMAQAADKWNEHVKSLKS